MDKKIIIVWSFDFNYIESEKMDQANGVYFKEFNVGGSNVKKLLAIRLDRNESDEKCMAIIKFIRASVESFDGKYLLLIHNKPPTKLMQKELPQHLPGIHFISFGGGITRHEMLYTKLITDSNYFQESAFAENYQTIKEDVFDEIWREYKVLRDLHEKHYEL